MINIVAIKSAGEQVLNLVLLIQMAIIITIVFFCPIININAPDNNFAVCCLKVLFFSLLSSCIIYLLNII
jgi:hypothetical protein